MLYGATMRCDLEMYNPSYLIKSRHNIYYFRYPIPNAINKRVSVSLKTRCPKVALKLAKALEYGATVLLSTMGNTGMNHKDAMDILKSYFAKLLEDIKERINNEGQLNQSVVDNTKENIRDLEEAINMDIDMLFESSDDTCPLKQDMKKILEHNNLSYEEGSHEYNLIKKSYKYAKRNCYQDVLAYNESFTNFSFLDESSKQNNTPSPIKPSHSLQTVIEKYLNERRLEKLSLESLEEYKVSFNYLTELLDKETSINAIGHEKAGEVKTCLMQTPANRNKLQLTRDLPLTEQIQVASQKSLKTLSNKSVKKYILHYNSLFEWAKDNKYIDNNIFYGIKIKSSNKNKLRRLPFTKDEVNKILANLTDKTLVKKDSFYWGALIAIYTGARRNEIAGLLPDDIKLDKSGIWYFNIDDEEESKSVKTEAATRVVPVHPRLIELGFLDFIQKSKHIGLKLGNVDGKTPRLLYELTFKGRDKWGKNLGKWFNERYLVQLKLKTPQKVLHSLRHSFITNLSIAGIEIANIKSMVGHEPETVTTEVYTHYGVEHLPLFKEAIEKLPY